MLLTGKYPKYTCKNVSHFSLRVCLAVYVGRVVTQVVEATSWKVAGIFHRLNPPGRTMAPGSIQPLTERSTRDLP